MDWLRPGETIGLVWQVSDPTDATVYYPQIIVQNAVDLTTLATINLNNKGNGQYHNTYQVPSDTGGFGFHITTTLRVWTDSGHSIISENYNVENRVYLVQLRPKQSFGSTQPTVPYDYDGQLKGIEKIIEKAVKSSPPGITKKQVQDIFKMPEKPQELEKIPAMEQIIGKLAEAFIKHAETTKKKLELMHELIVSHETKLGELHEKTKENDKKHKETLDTLQSAAQQMQDFSNGKMEDYAQEVFAAIREAFDAVELVQVSEKAQGLKKLNGGRKPQKDYQGIALSLTR